MSLSKSKIKSNSLNLDLSSSKLSIKGSPLKFALVKIIGLAKYLKRKLINGEQNSLKSHQFDLNLM